MIKELSIRQKAFSLLDIAPMFWELAHGSTYVRIKKEFALEPIAYVLPKTNQEQVIFISRMQYEELEGTFELVEKIWGEATWEDVFMILHNIDPFAHMERVKIHDGQ